MTEQEKRHKESRKKDADMLRELADLLENPKVYAKPMHVNINQTFDNVAESADGSTIVQLDRTISIEIETQEFVNSNGVNSNDQII